jgi:hypothetical protein
MGRVINILLALLLFSFAANAQEDIETKKFLSDFFKKQPDHGVVFYQDSVDAGRIVPIKRDTLRNGFPLLENGSVNTNYVVFSKEERAYIAKKIEEQKTATWSDGLLPNSKLITKATIKDIFNEREKGWIYFHGKYSSGFYTFSKPIFLKNNTICVFYYGYHCDYLCGYGDWSVYKKVNGDWVRIITFSSWVS